MGRRRANQTGSIYKRTITRNGKKYVYWCCEKEVSPGNVKQFSFKTQAEAVAKLNEINIEVQNEDYIEPSKITLAEWLDTFINVYCKNQKYQTLKSYKAQIRTHIKPGIGSYTLNKLSSTVIQKFYNQLAIDGKECKRKINGTLTITHEPLSAKSIKNIHTVLNLALEKAVDQELLKKNPTKKTVLPKIKKKEINPLTDEQANSFLEACSADSMGKMLSVILMTGMRESEALGLTWDCVDFENKTITINKQLVRHLEKDGGSTLEETKNGKTRTITVGSSVIQILNDRKKEDAQNRLKAGEIWQGWQDQKQREKALVFTNNIGSHFTQKATYKHCKKICEEIGVPECTVHGLRHTFATLSLQQGVDLKTVSKRLGHSTIAITADIYAHVSEKMDQEAADKLEAVFSKMA